MLSSFPRSRGAASPSLPMLFLALAIVLVSFPAALPHSGPSGATAPITAAVPVRDFGRLPLSFIPNVGLTDSAIRYQARGMGGTIFFTVGEVVLSLPAQRAAATAQHAAQAASARARSVVRLHFDGAAPTAELIGAERLPGIANFFLGADPSQWRPNVPTYAGVVYRQLYPGVDLRYDGADGTLKGTYTVAPLADPGAIRWRYAGAVGTRVDESTGDLFIDLAGLASSSVSHLPPLREKAPVAWQDRDGRRVSVSARYAIAPDGGVGFALGAYDPAYPLTIDPTLVYSTFIGGANTDAGRAITVDSAGNAYVTGRTEGDDFPTASPPQPHLNGWADAFVLKINAAGTALVYSTFLGGSDTEEGRGIAVDSAGNAYVAGSTVSSDFPTVAPVQASPTTYGDVFVTKLNASGSALVYSTYLGGDSIDAGYAIAVDSTGNAYITGRTDSTDFAPATPIQLTCHGFVDTFVVKLNAAGSARNYSTCLGGSDVELVGGIAVDSSGNVYLAGYTNSTDYPIKNPLQAARSGLADMFVTKINAAGSALVYSTYLGGSDGDNGTAIAVDTAGNAYITGNTFSTDFPVKNPLPNGGGTYHGGLCDAFSGLPCGDAFVTKLNSTGSAIVYGTYLGGSAGEYGTGIAVDSAGRASIVGVTNSADFPTKDALDSSLGGVSDAFVAQLDAAGSALVYNTYLGGSGISSDSGQGAETGYGIALDSAGAAYITGQTFSSDFPTVNPLQPTKVYINSDGFVAKIKSQDSPLPGLIASNDGPTTLGEPTTLKATLPFVTPATFMWDFGDGTNGAGATMTHMYKAPGTYVAIVTVTNSTGTASASTAVVVVPPLKTQVDFIGSSGGGVPAVTIVESLAYVGEGNQLTILDISNPAAPRRLGGYTASDRVQDVEVAGLRAYVTIDLGGLLILDISNPAVPRRLGGYDTPGHAYDVQVVGNRAYIADGPGSGLQIINVGNPAAPTLLGSFPMNAYDLQVVNERAYVTATFDGLYILNVADPANPKVFTQEYTSGSPAVGIQVVGDRAYVASGNGGLRILNVSNLTPNQSPTEIGYNNQLGTVKDLHVVGDRAFVVNYDGTLHILDVSTPSSPQLLSSYDTPGDSWDVRVVSGRAYVADGDGGLLILNVSDARYPAKLGTYATWSAYNLKVVGARAYIAGGQTGLHILDISDPSHPRRLGGLALAGLAVDVDVAGDQVYVARRGIWNGSSYVGGGFEIVNVADPAHPVSLGSFSIELANAVQVIGTRAYVAAVDGLHILNISTPATISEQGKLPGLIVWDVQVIDSRAYLAAEDASSGLAIIDVSVPSTPKQLGADLTMSDARAVKVVDNLAYVAGGNELRVLDVTDAQHPSRRGYHLIYNSAARLLGLDVVGSLAYLVGETLNDGDLAVVDVAKLTGDVMLKSLYEQDQSSLTTAIQKVGDLAYIAAEEGGLQVLRVRTEFDGPVPTQITSAGGSLSNYDGRVTLEFPPLATTEPLTITYTGLFAPTQSLGSARAATQSFKLEARNAKGQAVTHFVKPYKLVIRYDDAELAALGTDEDSLNLAFWNGSAWVNVLPCTGCGVDKVNNRLTAVSDHFTEFALLGAHELAGDGRATVFVPIVRR